MDIRAVLFDVNGTLIDIATDEGLADIYRAIGHFLTYQGIALHRGEVRDRYVALLQVQRQRSSEVFPEWDAVALWHEFLQLNASDYTRSLPPAYLVQLPRMLAELHRGIARKRLRLYPQVQETLALLRDQYALAVVTDAQTAYAIPELVAVGIREYFDPIIVSGDYGYRKPDPRLFHHALVQLGVPPEHAVFVGNDRYHDIWGAQQAGMKAIHVTYQPEHAPEQQMLPDETIGRFADLPQALEHLRLLA